MFFVHISGHFSRKNWELTATTGPGSSSSRSTDLGQRATGNPASGASRGRGASPEMAGAVG
jgi:hypothetical protein